MVLIVGASCLYKAINFLPSWQRKSLEGNIFARPGLSFNNCISKLKNLQHLLSHGSLNGRTDLIIWHDILSNSITPHRTNNNTPQSTDELIATLKIFRQNIKAILYNRRFGTPQLFDKLCEHRVSLVISVQKHLLSRRKQKSPWFVQEIQKVHPDVNIEINFVNIILAHESNLRKLTLKKRSKARKRKSESIKQKQKLRKLAQQPRDQSEKADDL